MNFSDLALNQLLTEYPELAPFILSFREMNDELPEDSGASVGVIMLNLMGALYYIPVVAKGDQLFPFDSLYSADEQKFLPLTKTILKELLAQPGTIGRQTVIPGTVDQNPSIYNMVTPPKTGKFVYAGTSRTVEFLAAMPGHVKVAFESQLFDRPPLMKALSKVFGLDSISAALKVETPTSADTPLDTAKVITDGIGLDSSVVRQILERGYAVQGAAGNARVAVQLSNQESNTFYEIGPKDVGFDLEVVLIDGSTKRGFLAKPLEQGQSAPDGVLIFEDGSYTKINRGLRSLVGRGEPVKPGEARVSALGLLQASNPARALRDVVVKDTFVITQNGTDVFGPFTADKVVISHLGVEINARHELGGRSLKLFAYNSYVQDGYVNLEKGVGFFSATDPVLILNSRAQDDFQTSVFAAKQMAENMLGADVLGPMHQITHSYGMFSYDQKPVGGLSKIIEILVVNNGLPETTADQFVKAAKENGLVQFKMSKEASENQLMSGIIPETVGATVDTRVKNPLALPQDPNEVIPGNSLDAMQDAAAIGDQDILESTIISQLLQNPDLYGLINEYLPEIQSAQDKIGRSLLLLRVNMNKLSEVASPDQVFGLISQVRNVYRMLGDATLKLKRMAAATNVES